MVHALQEVHRLLEPAGCLLDIHPTRDPTLIEVRRRGEILLSVPVPGQTFEDIGHADGAIHRVSGDGLFTLEQAIGFEFRTYASSVAELRDYIAGESVYDDCPSSEMLALEDPAMAARVEAVIQARPREAQVVRLNPARISRLRPLPLRRAPAA